MQLLNYNIIVSNSMFKGGSSIRLHDSPDLKLFIFVGWSSDWGSTDDLLMLQISSGVVWQSRVSNFNVTHCIC